MNAIDLLIKQHRELEGFMDEWMDADSEDKRRELLVRAGDHLSLHLASEEQVFFPTVKAKCTEDKLLESLEEHLSLKRLLADLIALTESPMEKTFEAKFHVLQEQCEHHHKEEEEDLFPNVRKLFDDRDLDSLGEEILALQKRMSAKGEPREAMAAQTDHAAELR